MRVVVIGSGFGGLAAAIRLQAQGHAVTLLEARDKPGGRAYVFEQDGFTFDAGPTILTAPDLLRDLFATAGRRLEDYVTLVQLDPFYNIRFEDGSVFAYNGDRAHLLEEIRRFNPGDVAGYERLRAHAERIYATGMDLITTPFLRFTDMLAVAPDLVRLGAYRSVASFAGRYLRDPRLRQVFSFHPLLIGGNPFDATAIYALIHPLEQHGGVWFAMGGTGALVRAMARVFAELGGMLLLNSRADEIGISARTGRATSVHVAGGDWIPADAVVSNADVATTNLKLIPARYRRHNTDRRIQRKHYSMSLFVIYFGTDRRYEQMAHHEILMGPRYRELLADIFHTKHLADDFSLYLHRPTATDRSLAPEGHDCWYVLSPVPHLGGDVDWEQAATPYRDAIMAYLEERYLPDLRAHIVTERHVDPRYFERDLGSYLGSAFSVEPILTQSAWFRPHNRSEDIPNLYLVGAGTHPGAGVPGVLSSGKIAADLIGPARPSIRGDVAAPVTSAATEVQWHTGPRLPRHTRFTESM